MCKRSAGVWSLLWKRFNILYTACSKMNKNRTWCMAKNCPGFGVLHCLPTAEERRKKWLANLNMEEWEVRAMGRICDKHFERSCVQYGTDRLLRNAIPTLHLGHDKLVPHAPEIRVQEKRIKKRVCKVAGCDNTSETHQLSVLPKDEPRRSYWRKVCKLEKGNFIYVCSKHFEPHCYRNNRLSTTAVPSLFLNNENAETEKEISQSSWMSSLEDNSQDVGADELDTEQSISLESASNCSNVLTEEEISLNSEMSSIEDPMDDNEATEEDESLNEGEAALSVDLDCTSNLSNETIEQYVEEYLDDDILTTDSGVSSFECFSVGENKEKMYAEEDCACACAIENVKLKNQYDKKIKELQAIIDILYSHRRKLEKQIITMAQMQTKNGES